MPFTVEHLERVRITIRRNFQSTSLLGLVFAALWDYFLLVRFRIHAAFWLEKITALLVTVAAVVNFLWLLTGQEIIEVGPDVLRHRKQVLLLHWTDNYPADKVVGLHWVPAEQPSFHIGHGSKARRSGIVFECEGRPATIADGLTEDEFKQVMTEISARYPYLAERWQQSHPSDPAFTWLRLS